MKYQAWQLRLKDRKLARRIHSTPPQSLLSPQQQAFVKVQADCPLVILTGGNHQLSNLPRIPESFRRGPDKLAESASKMTLACKTSPQRDVRNPEICF